MNKKGFTLIEILLVISIIGIMFSVVLPISYSMYQRYRASLKAEEVLLLISTLRINAFLYNEEKLIRSENGKLLIDDGEPAGYGDIFIQIDRPIKFYRTGTTSGGAIKIYAHDYSFLIDIRAPFGGLTLNPSG